MICVSHCHTGSYDCLIVRSVAMWRTCDRSAMFATIARSFFLVVGHRTIAWSYAWSRDQHRLEKIVRLVVVINDRSYDRSWPPTIDRMINSVGRWMGSDLNPRNISTFYSVIRFGIAGFKLWTWPSTLLRLICPLRSRTTSATSRTTSATSRTIVLRLAHHSNIFRSQVGRNLVVSPVWPGFEHDYDLVATDLPLAITHHLCHQSYDLCHQSYVLSTIDPFFGRR